ncbi:hypothetical protein [Nocardia abscessus]|uniref:Transposase n=1 Tax=Nocardia abscessus TaxID=120957 RepID=A0ABS0CD69_9NOCA|nr:hypothetical protein [Nocardia abscessus]MBF6228286.1 hypothetical protein [Nocardia abscessus]
MALLDDHTGKARGRRLPRISQGLGFDRRAERAATAQPRIRGVHQVGEAGRQIGGRTAHIEAGPVHRDPGFLRRRQTGESVKPGLPVSSLRVRSAGRRWWRTGS